MPETEVADFALSALHAHGRPLFVREAARPDEVVRDAPAIDFTTTSGDSIIAIEHTRGEPYEGFLADWNLTHQRLGPVRDLLARRLPDDSSSHISIAPASANRITTKHVDGIVEWIAEQAPTLGSPSMRTHFAHSPPELCPAVLTIYRWPYQEGEPRDPGVRYRIGVEPDKLKDQIRARYRRALADKLENSMRHEADWARPKRCFASRQQTSRSPTRGS